MALVGRQVPRAFHLASTSCLLIVIGCVVFYWKETVDALAWLIALFYPSAMSGYFSG